MINDDDDDDDDKVIGCYYYYDCYYYEIGMTAFQRKQDPNWSQFGKSKL